MIKETTWSIDQAHSEILFEVTQLKTNYVKGAFKTFDASIRTTGKDFTTAVINLWIEAASVQTVDGNRDEHLRSKDFLDVQNHKQIKFTSSSIEDENDQGCHDLWGDFTIKGITHKVKLSVCFGEIVVDTRADEKASLSLIGKFTKSDWGLVWNQLLKAGDIMVGDEVTLLCELGLINTTNKQLPLEVTLPDYEVTL